MKLLGSLVLQEPAIEGLVRVGIRPGVVIVAGQDGDDHITQSEDARLKVDREGL